MGFCRHLGRCFYQMQAEDETAAGASPFAAPPDAGPSSLAHFHPGIAALIVGALIVIFSLSFLFFLYAKHYKRFGDGGGPDPPASSAAAAAAAGRNSGVEWTVVLSLPVFRFDSLLGQKEGLECAVCLARFEPAEVLRLLPKCKHAFHVECVDTWLDSHSTCPLCRSRVDPEDVLLVPDPETPPASAEPAVTAEKRGEFKGVVVAGKRVSGRHSSAGEKSSDSADPDESRYRKSADSMARKSAVMGCFDRGRKDSLLLEERESVERRFGHRIIVSGGCDGMQERWSDLRPSDLLFLRSERIITDSGRYSVSRAGRPSCSMSVMSSARCASEITGVSRSLHPSAGGGGRRVEEERTMRRWLGFAAKRSAQWARSRDRG